MSAVQDLSYAVDDVQEQVRVTNMRIDDLGPATRKLISDERIEDDAIVARFMESPTWGSTQEMFTAAKRLNAVANSIACKIGTSQRWLFFVTGAVPTRTQGFAPALQVWLDFSETNERIPGSVFWVPNEDVHAFMGEVALGLKRLQKYPGDDEFDASAIFTTLGNTVRAAIDYRHDGCDIGPLFAIVNLEWALTERGLE